MAGTKIIAHRGASGYAPENTMPAFQKAIEMGADGIEIDLHMSMDGHLIVMHDEWVNRTTNGKGLIRDMTLKELKKLDCGKWFDDEYEGAKIPTLEEVLDLIRHWDGFLNIEIKGGSVFYPGIEKRACEIIKMFCFDEQIVFSSFNHYSMSDIKSNATHLKVGLLYSDRLYQPWNYAKLMDADALHPPYFHVDPHMVECCKDKGILINAWTVNDEAEMTRLLQLKIHGIITNYPDIALQARHLQQQGSGL